jgi:hypothetical protein
VIFWKFFCLDFLVLNDKADDEPKALKGDLINRQRINQDGCGFQKTD